MEDEKDTCDFLSVLIVGLYWSFTSPTRPEWTLMVHLNSFSCFFLGLSLVLPKLGGVEWLQLKENDFAYRPNMICSFIHENEDEAEAPASKKRLRVEEQETNVKESSHLICDQQKAPEAEDSGPPVGLSSEMEGSVLMETQFAA